MDPNTQPPNNAPAPPSNPYPKEDQLFLVTPPQKKPLDKRSVIFVATLSVVGVILLLVVIVFALIGSATSLANDYRRLASVQIKKIASPLKELEPSAVLSGRNLDTPGKKIAQSQQSQPSLENVLFVGAWSEQYTQTQQLEKNVRQHYKNVQTYQDDLKKLIAFNSELDSIIKQEPLVAATVTPTNSLSIRSAGGSYQSYATNIDKLDAPPQISTIKKQLVKSYQAKSKIYSDWAALVEAGNMGGEQKAKADLLVESGNTVTLIEDQTFVALLTPTHTKLLSDQKTLEKQLIN